MSSVNNVCALVQAAWATTAGSFARHSSFDGCVHSRNRRRKRSKRPEEGQKVGEDRILELAPQCGLCAVLHKFEHAPDHRVFSGLHSVLAARAHGEPVVFRVHAEVSDEGVEVLLQVRVRAGDL